MRFRIKCAILCLKLHKADQLDDLCSFFVIIYPPEINGYVLYAGFAFILVCSYKRGVSWIGIGLASKLEEF